MADDGPLDGWPSGEPTHPKKKHLACFCPFSLRPLRIVVGLGQPLRTKFKLPSDNDSLVRLLIIDILHVQSLRIYILFFYLYFLPRISDLAFEVVSVSVPLLSPIE